MPSLDGYKKADDEAMSIALEDVCRDLNIGNDLKFREVVARRIIELARRGELDPTQLRDRILAGANGGKVDVA
jgi:hypothetical protein